MKTYDLIDADSIDVQEFEHFVIFTIESDDETIRLRVTKDAYHDIARKCQRDYLFDDD